MNQMKICLKDGIVTHIAKIYFLVSTKLLFSLSLNNKTPKGWGVRNISGLDGTRTRDPMRDRHVF